MDWTVCMCQGMDLNVGVCHGMKSLASSGDRMMGCVIEWLVRKSRGIECWTDNRMCCMCW